MSSQSWSDLDDGQFAPLPQWRFYCQLPTSVGSAATGLLSGTQSSFGPNVASVGGAVFGGDLGGLLGALGNLGSNLSSVGAALTDTQGYQPNGASISFLVQRVSAPTGTLEIETVPFQGGSRNFPTGRTMDALTLTLCEDANMYVLPYLVAWRDSVLDKNGNFGLPALYCQPIVLQCYDSYGALAGTFAWNSAYPTHITGYDFDGTATGHVTPTVAFSVNSDDFTLNGY